VSSFPKSALKAAKPAHAEEPPDSSPEVRPTRAGCTPRASVVASARKQALTWLDDEASASGDESDDESSEGGASSDDDFVVSDGEVEYASDASDGAIQSETIAQSGGVMPNAGADRTNRVAKSNKKTKKTPSRGVTFFSPDKDDDAGAIELSSDEEDAKENEEVEGDNGNRDDNKSVAARKPEKYDPYCLDGLKTPTPPKAPSGTPYNPKTPKSAIGRKPGGGEYLGYGEAPVTHSKALAAALASAAKPGKRLNFARHKETIAAALYAEFNKDGFDGALPSAFEITWNAKLLTTAGLTHYRKITRSSGKSEFHARIEASISQSPHSPD